LLTLPFGSRGDILEDLLLQGEIGDKPAQAGVLPFQILQALGPLDLQAALLFRSTEVALL
jgi:hypothetical protein